MKRDKLSETLKKKLWEEYGAQKDENGQTLERRAKPRSTASKEDYIPAKQGPNYLQWLGAAISAGLVILVIYWVFQLGQRDATKVPVIRAMAGEARELPENPGGPEVDNQGLQVNEVLASDATAPVEPETILAPPPQRVVEEDVTPPAETPAPAPILVPLVPVPPPQTEPQTEVSTASELPPSLPGADPNMTRPARRVPAPALPDSADLLSNAIANAILEANGEAPANAPTQAPSTPPSFAGEKMIQLGAYDDEESANRDYDALLADNQDLMGDLVRFVERREAGGRVFYRLRARGFASMEDAAAMCEALLARSIQCIAVTAQ